MEPVATYFDPQQLELAEAAFRKLGIPYTVREGEGEVSGTELLVESEHYERACDVVERLEEFLHARAVSTGKGRICPVCKNCELELCVDMNAEEFVTGISFIFQCPQCGYLRAE